MSYADSSNLSNVLEQYTYSYDKNSNIVSETIVNNYPTNQLTESDAVTGDVITNEYDTMNQLIKSTLTNNGETRYTQVNTYNYNGQRISKSDNGVVTYYFYQDGVLLYTTDAQGNKTS